MTYTHKIDADKILTMGKGARKTWRLLGLPESRTASMATQLRRGAPSFRRMYRAVQRHDVLALIPPGDPWSYPEPAPGDDDWIGDYLKD